MAEPTSGGVPVYLERIAAQQAARGDEVHILAPSGRAYPPGAVAHEWPLARSRPSTFAAGRRTFSSLVESLSPDVVHLHSFMAGWLGRLVPSSGTSHAVVYQPHAWAMDRYHDVRAWAVGWWERYASTRTDVVVTNCEDEIEQGRSHGIRTPAASVGVPVDVGYFRPPIPEEQREARHRLGRPDLSMVLVVGRIAFQKAQDTLVAEWERNPPPGCELVLLGAGQTASLAASAPRQWGRSIRHVGSSDDVRSWLWAADVVAIPSRYETVSLVAAEAMAVGTSVVATRFNGAVEAITSGGRAAGQVCDVGDMRGILDACYARVSSPDGFRSERVSGPERVNQKFRAEAVAARLSHAYELASRSKGRR